MRLLCDTGNPAMAQVTRIERPRWHFQAVAPVTPLWDDSETQAVDFVDLFGRNDLSRCVAQVAAGGFRRSQGKCRRDFMANTAHNRVPVQAVHLHSFPQIVLKAPVRMAECATHEMDCGRMTLQAVPEVL